MGTASGIVAKIGPPPNENISNKLNFVIIKHFLRIVSLYRKL
jgi:hypothetical protein